MTIAYEMARGMPLALVPLLAITFVDVLGFSILIPLLPFYAEHFGASVQLVGLLTATVAICGLLSSPFLGALSDRLGRRKILLITQTATALAYFLLARATSLPTLFMARAIEGISSGGLGVTQAYVADVTEPGQRAQAYGYLGMTYGLGFIFGPVLSGVLVRFGYDVPFLTAAAISVCTIFLTLWLLPESHTPPEKHTAPLAAIREALTMPQLRRLLSIQFCFTLAFTMWVSVLALFLQRVLAFGPSQVSLLYAASGVIGAIMQGLVVGRLVARFGPRRILFTGLTCALTTYLAIAGVTQVIPMIAAVCCWSFGYALARPTLSTLLSEAAPADRRGAFMGASDASNDLAFCIGPIVSTTALAHNPHLVGIFAGSLNFKRTRLSNEFTIGTAYGVRMIAEAAIDPLLVALKSAFGYDGFRPQQEEIIRTTLDGRDVFALLPTGGGKSLCYQLPALLIEGLTVVVSPLIALMKDQVDALNASGVRATFLNSTLNPEQARERVRDLEAGTVRLLYVAPERLFVDGFLERLARWNVQRIAIDEAHCISEWGHDFRPEYRRLGEVRRFFPDVPIIAMTATATDRVRGDIIHHLHLRTPQTFLASFNRPNLRYLVLEKSRANEQVLQFMRAHSDESGIIYCGSRKGTESLAEYLQLAGFSAAAYHAGQPPDQRNRNQEAFLRDDIRVICATHGVWDGREQAQCALRPPLRSAEEHRRLLPRNRPRRPRRLTRRVRPTFRSGRRCAHFPPN